MLTSIRALGRIRNLVFSFFVKRLGGLSQCFFNAPQAYNKFKVLSYKDIELDAVGHGRTVGITQRCPAMPFHARSQPVIQVVNKAAALEWSFHCHRPDWLNVLWPAPLLALARAKGAQSCDNLNAAPFRFSFDQQNSKISTQERLRKTMPIPERNSVFPCLNKCKRPFELSGRWSRPPNHANAVILWD